MSITRRVSTSHTPAFWFFFRASNTHHTTCDDHPNFRSLCAHIMHITRRVMTIHTQFGSFTIPFWAVFPPHAWALSYDHLCLARRWLRTCTSSRSITGRSPSLYTCPTNFKAVGTWTTRLHRQYFAHLWMARFIF